MEKHNKQSTYSIKYLILIFSFILLSTISFSQKGVYREINDSLENDGGLILKWNRKFEYSDYTRYNCFGGKHIVRGHWKRSNDTLICTNIFNFEEEDFIIDSLNSTTGDSIIIKIKNEKNEPLKNVEVNYRYDRSILVNPYFTDSSGQIVIGKKVLEPNLTEDYYKKSVSFSVISPNTINTISVSTGLSTKTNIIYITLVENPKKEIIERKIYFKKEDDTLRYLKIVNSSETNIDEFNYWENRQFKKD